MTTCHHSFPDPHPAPLTHIRDCRHCGTSYQDAKAAMTAADELRTAACALRARAAKTEAGLAAALREGTRDLFGKTSVDRAAMHPEVGGALADWLDSAAIDAEQIGPDPHALAVARAILGTQETT
jgi:hypothetical protein